MAASLLTLPTELRLLIYEMVFQDALSRKVLSRVDCYPLPPILRTCRTLRREAANPWAVLLRSASVVRKADLALTEAAWREISTKVEDWWLSYGERDDYMHDIETAKFQANVLCDDLEVLSTIAQAGRNIVMGTRAYGRSEREALNIRRLLYPFGRQLRDRRSPAFNRAEDRAAASKAHWASLSEAW